MISRRQALKAGATVLAAPSLNTVPTHMIAAAGSQESTSHVATAKQLAGSTDPVHQGLSLDRQIAILWTYEAPVTMLFGTPPPQNNLLYIPRDYLVSAISLAAGETIWEADIIQAGTEIHQITEELLVVTSQYRVATGGLQVLDARTGQELWRLGAGGGGQNAPELVDGTIYIGMSGSFMALTATTGDPVWTVENAQGYPVVQDDTVYVVCHDFVHENGDVLAINRLTGQIDWRITRPGWQSLQAPGNTFLLVEDNLLIFHADDTTLQAVDIATGAESWRYRSDEQVRLQAISSGVLCVASYTNILALDPQTGEELWRFGDGQNLYVALQNGSNIFVSAGPVLYALDAATGTTVWQFTTGQEEVFGSIRADEKSIFVAGQSLYGLDAATGTERMRYQLPIDPFFDRGSVVIGQHHLFLEYGSDQIFALGNVAKPKLVMDVTLRAAPSSTSPERGSASAGKEIESIGNQSERNGETWVEATIDGIGGWIPLEAIDQSTLPPEGEVEIIYTP